MANDTYEPPARPMGPLVGLLDDAEHSESFASVDRRERTDPRINAPRPTYLDPTPAGLPRREMAAIRAASLARTPEPEDETVVWPWVVGGLTVGTFVTLLTMVWFALVFTVDEEGLLPEARDVAEVSR